MKSNYNFQSEYDAERESDIQYMIDTVCESHLGVSHIKLELNMLARLKIDDSNWRRYLKFENYYEDLIRDMISRGIVIECQLNPCSKPPVLTGFKKM